MKKIFDRILQNSNETDETNLNSASIVAMSKDSGSGANDSITFDFVFDDNGDYVYTASEHGFGKRVNVHGKLTTPEGGIYAIKIDSSDGGGGQWDGINTNQEISCYINTSFWHKTTITVSIHSNKPNYAGHAIIDYFV